MKTAEFGQPVTHLPMPGKCRICGCTHDRPCVSSLPLAEFSYSDPRPCSWADETRTLCNAPACIAEAKREIGR